MSNKINGEITLKRTTLFCYECGHRLQGDDEGRYFCHSCELEFNSEYDIVKEYLRTYGVTEALRLSNLTGVSMSKLNYYLRKGMVEIANCSKAFIKCKKCGVEIKYGNYCPNCAKVLAPLLTQDSTLEIDIGELAPVKKQGASRMRYLDKE